MKRYAKMTTEMLWRKRATYLGKIEDILYRANRDRVLANTMKIKRLKEKRDMIDVELKKRGQM